MSATSPSVDRRRHPGSRGRIGIVQPAPGVMLEHEWPRWLPPDVLFPVGRIRMTGGATEASYRRMAEAAPEAARDLASAGADLVAYACTVGSLFAGPAAEGELVERLSAAAGLPAISLAATSMRALRAVGATRVALLTPYTDAINEWIAHYLDAARFAVTGIAATPLDLAEVGSMPPAEVAECAVATLARFPDSDALWMPCTALQTIDAIDAIEARTGLPAVSGSQALLWHALALLEVDDPIHGAGRLFGCEVP